MTSRIVKLTAAVLELPAAQRAVLLPLFTWGLIKNAPKDAVVPEALQRDVEEFFESLGSDPEQRSRELESRLQSAGVTSATLRALAIEAGTDDDTSSLKSFATSVAGRFEERSAPTDGQTRAGPSARFALASLLPSDKK